jgi:hypothetical protein
MHETTDDLDRLQSLLDASYEAAGEHLREVITPERRLSARDLAAELTGMRLLVVATVTRDGRPISGPLDSIFHRGRFYAGSSPHAVRFRHLEQRPWVSATHLPGEALSVTVHGRATRIDVAAPEHADVRRSLLDVYVPRYGPEWEQFLDSGPVYIRIDPDRMFTFSMPEEP